MKDLEQLVQYLDGELNEVQKHQFTEKLKNDPSLGKKKELIEDVDKLIGDKQLLSFEECLKEVEALYKIENKKVQSSRIIRLKWMKAAAVVIFIVGVSTLFFLNHNSMRSGDELFAEYYAKMPADFATRSALPENDAFLSAIQMYNANMYSEAIIEFNKILQKDPTNNAARLFLGICYAETKQFKVAASQFKNIIENKDPIFEEHASWYLSLCYIKTQNTEAARKSLSGLVNSQSFYKGKASQLLKELP
jgi:tetratricopeptide (TPR) repeat protein